MLACVSAPRYFSWVWGVDGARYDGEDAGGAASGKVMLDANAPDYAAVPENRRPRTLASFLRDER